MSSPQIKIRVGAAADASLTTIFRTLADTVAKARKTIDDETKSAGKAVAANMKAGTSAAERDYAKLVASIEGDGSSMMNKPGQAMKKFGDDAKQHFGAVRMGFDAMARDAEQSLARIAKATPQTLISRLQEGNGPTGRALLGAGRAALGFGMRMAGDLARSAGVDLDASSQFGKNADLQKTLVDITNSGYMPGQKGANGQRQDAGRLGAELAKTATETGFATNDAASGLQAFVAKTGDLETGRAVFKDLAVLSKATGTNLEDMVDAAGDVSNGLGDIPNKGEKIQQVMRAIAGQGKLGAVEIRNLATQMAKLSAGAGQISGDAGKNIALLGALAQESRAKGGSASATQAATSVTSFMNTFSKGARLDAFKTFGVGVTDQKTGLLRNPMEIIKDAIRAASTKNGGMANFNENMGDMFKDVQARRSVKGFETTFLQAGGGEAGMAAVSAEMDKLIQSTMGQEEITKSFGNALSTAESQANVLNNQLQASANEMQKALLPAMVALSPAILAVAKDAASLGLGFAGLMKKLGIGGDEASDDFTSNAEALNEATELAAKQKAGTATPGDIEHAKATFAHLEERQRGKEAEFAAANATKPGFFEKATAAAFDDSPIGRIANKLAGTKLGKGLIDEKSTEINRRNGELDQLTTITGKLGSAIGPTQPPQHVILVGDRTGPLTQPQVGKLPVNAQP